jgi:RNA polymerase sigma-70 factor (ECF subfamily)
VSLATRNDGQMSIPLSRLPDPLLSVGMELSGPQGGRWRAGMSSPTAAPPPDDRDLADAELLRRIAAGDRAAFGQLYDRFSRPLYATAVRIVQDASDAQDIVHDAFVVVWEKANTFETQRGTAFSWLVTLVRNRAIDRVRSRRRRQELLSTSVPTDLGYDDATQPRPADDQAAAGDDARTVRAAVATLAPEQQKALELAFFSGLTQEEIARSLGEPLGTVKARIRRGLMKLRDSLASRS